MSQGLGCRVYSRTGKPCSGGSSASGRPLFQVMSPVMCQGLGHAEGVFANEDMHVFPGLHVGVQGYLAHKETPTPLGPP